MAETDFVSKIQYIRELEKLPELEIGILQKQAGSQDPELAAEAKDKLMHKWDLEPAKDSLNAPSIDINQQFESTYNADDRRVILHSIIGIQLTEGCNGSCPFCLFGQKEGVKAKFSFDSLKEFLNKRKNALPSGLTLYWNSDPFDYRDGEHSFVDVFNAWYDIKPDANTFISTALPKGSEENFIEFMVSAAKRFKTERKFSLRFSLTRGNIQRVEATMKLLDQKLSQSKMSLNARNKFYSANIETTNHIDSFDNLGAFINKHDDFVEFFTPACEDGVILKPLFPMAEAVMPTLPTVYEPSGQKTSL